MSIKQGPMDPSQSTVLTIWQDILVEAALSHEEAVAVAIMMLGIICANCTDTEADAHGLVNDTIPDIHEFINANYRHVIEQRKQQRSNMQ